MNSLVLHLVILSVIIFALIATFVVSSLYFLFNYLVSGLGLEMICCSLSGMTRILEEEKKEDLRKYQINQLCIQIVLMSKQYQKI